MKVLILDDADKATGRAAGLVIDAVTRNPRAVLGLATGGTMEGVYRHLVMAHRDGLSLARVRTFNLDEYVGLAPDHSQSYHRYMAEHLFGKTDLEAIATHLPRGDAEDPEAEAARYDALIAATGGIDLQLLGIGHNGHIGFNEPTSSLASPTRIKTLTEDTRAANRRFFGADEAVPTFAITMGIGTILKSRACLLLATGEAKAEAVAAMVEGPLSAACPASVLQMHPRATIVLDRPAAAALRLVDYYDHVHPAGRERHVG